MKHFDYRPRMQRLFYCQCGQPIFFRNSLCLNCSAPLGYDPDAREMRTLTPTDDPALFAWNGTHYRQCANLHMASGCNWLIPANSGTGDTYCAACKLNRTIPDLTVAGNDVKWRRVEESKRRLVSSLLALGLPAVPKSVDGNGLAFDFLAPSSDGTPLMTGHLDGVITINIEEADDSKREETRQKLRESYRTVLGHLRHESGHYYWNLMMQQPGRLDAFRQLFGDEREDYGAALERHYARVQDNSWTDSYVSFYASAHPAEDWAETWAHYLHIMDTLDTAASLGVTLKNSDQGLENNRTDFERIVAEWVRLTLALNELSRGMGLRDFYPFVLSPAVVNKLMFVHDAITANRLAQKQNSQPGEPDWEPVSISA